MNLLGSHGNRSYQQGLEYVNCIPLQRNNYIVLLLVKD